MILEVFFEILEGFRYANGFELQPSMETKVCGIVRKWMMVFYSIKIFFIGNFLDPKLDGSQSSQICQNVASQGYDNRGSDSANDIVRIQYGWFLPVIAVILCTKTHR